MLMDKVKENEKLIASFEGIITKEDKKYYSFLSAINALDNNNEIQEEFVNTIDEEGTKGKYLLRLYGLLQGLFVSIDSLYSLAYDITGSKSIININNNEDLRELKYIRNDVVGHPNNRIYQNSQIGYCVLKKEDITKTKFMYYIYFNGEITNRSVDLEKMLNAYYDEANSLLRNLRKASDDLSNNNYLLKTIRRIYDDFNRGVDILNDLEILKKDYISKYGKDTNDRVSWRIDLISDLINYKYPDKDISQLIDYATAYQISKLYQACYNFEHDNKLELDIAMKTPKCVIAFYKMLNKNGNLISCINYLYESKGPLFLPNFELCYKYAKKMSLELVTKYLEFIKSERDKKHYDIAYCAAVVLKRYKKFK